ncbi:MAG: Chitin deacetylase [Herbinix sp.]|nr:Chitin deacetylase [Herbinix sp.]
MSFSTLMYHEIRKRDTFQPTNPSPINVKQNYNDILPSPLFVTLEHFEEQMAYLYHNNFHTLTLDEVKAYYYEHIELPKQSVLLSFDDCYQSIKQYAYPILKKYGFHGVAFVVTGWLHDEPKEFHTDQSVCMAESDLNTISDVFEYANHTDLFHTRTNNTVGRIMTAEDDVFIADLARCNQKNYITNKDVFAYPFGFYQERNVDLLRNNGFKLAFTSEVGCNNLHTDPLLLKRNAIPYFMDLTSFKNIVNTTLNQSTK